MKGIFKKVQGIPPSKIPPTVGLNGEPSTSLFRTSRESLSQGVIPYLPFLPLHSTRDNARAGVVLCTGSCRSSATYGLSTSWYGGNLHAGVHLSRFREPTVCPPPPPLTARTRLGSRLAGMDSWQNGRGGLQAHFLGFGGTGEKRRTIASSLHLPWQFVMKTTCGRREGPGKAIVPSPARPPSERNQGGVHPTATLFRIGLFTIRSCRACAVLTFVGVASLPDRFEPH